MRPEGPKIEVARAGGGVRFWQQAPPRQLGSGERCELPQRGLGRSHGQTAQRFSIIFSTQDGLS